MFTFLLQCVKELPGILSEYAAEKQYQAANAYMYRDHMAYLATQVKKETVKGPAPIVRR